MLYIYIIYILHIIYHIYREGERERVPQTVKCGVSNYPKSHAIEPHVAVASECCPPSLHFWPAPWPYPRTLLRACSPARLSSKARGRPEVGPSRPRAVKPNGLLIGKARPKVGPGMPRAINQNDYIKMIPYIIREPFPVRNHLCREPLQ